MAASLGVDTDDIVNEHDLAGPSSATSSASTSPSSSGTKIKSPSGASNLSARERNRLKRTASKQQQAEQKAKKAKRAAAILYKADVSRQENGYWPFRDFVKCLLRDLFDEAWEVRHGSATALRDLVRAQGKSLGHTSFATKEENQASHRIQVIDLALKLISVIAKDKFGDFVSDQVVAPVRESSAQALGSVVALLDKENALNVAELLLRLTKEENWQCRHGALLGVKYVLATRFDLTKELLELFYPSIYEGLKDETDDVVGVAASSLLPVVRDCIINENLVDILTLKERLWDALKVLDEVTSSMNSIMDLLSEILGLQSDMRPESLLGDTRPPLTEAVPRLFSFVSHNSWQVRKAALSTLKTLTANPSVAELFLPRVVQGLCHILIQRALLEHHQVNLDLIMSTWNDICDNTPLAPLLMSVCPVYGSWMTLISMPPLWPLQLNNTDGSHVHQYLGGPEAQHLVDEEERDKYAMRARKAGCRMLGKLAGFICREVPGMDYSQDSMPPLDMFVTKILMPMFNTNAVSAWRRIGLCLVISEWTDQHAVERVPDTLKTKLNEFLGEVSLNYEEVMQPFTELRIRSGDYFATLKHYNLCTPKMQENWNSSNPGQLSFQQIHDFLFQTNFKELFANCKLKRALVTNLLERREGLASLFKKILQDQSVLKVSSKAALAGAVVDLKALPERLNPVIQPLMESIKKENNRILQELAAKKLAKVLELCVDKGSISATEKVIKNLIALMTSDQSLFPTFHEDPGSQENRKIVTLALREAKSAVSKKNHKKAVNKNAAANELLVADVTEEMLAKEKAEEEKQEMVKVILIYFNIIPNLFD